MSAHPIIIQQYSPSGWTKKQTGLVAETPVSLTVNGEAWLTFMCTPTDVEALGLGFLFNEGVVQKFNEVANIHLCEHGDNLDIWLTHAVEQPQHWKRTSGCTGGMTAVESLAELVDLPLETHTKVTPQQISALMEQLLDAQVLYHETGGVHTSVLSDGEKNLAAAEDIGRHNTLDKIAGLFLMKNIHPEKRILLTTGRISSEMLQKAMRLGVEVVISRTAPSSLAVELAEKAGITLIGYARRERFNVYAHIERIQPDRENPLEDGSISETR